MEGRAVTRQYSILTTAATTGHFTLVIKVYPEGVMSGRVRGWGLGSRISCRGPFGSPPSLAGCARVVGLCQGTGLVPLLPLVEELLEEQESDTIVTILYSSSSVDDLLLLDRLHELCSYWNFHLKIFLSSGEGLAGRWGGRWSLTGAQGAPQDRGLPQDGQGGGGQGGGRGRHVPGVWQQGLHGGDEGGAGGGGGGAGAGPLLLTRTLGLEQGYRQEFQARQI